MSEWAEKMAIYDRLNTRDGHDTGHGTRLGFRIASLVAIGAFIGFLAFFLFAPSTSENHNPATGGDSALEQEVAPPKSSAAGSQ